MSIKLLAQCLTDNETGSWRSRGWLESLLQVSSRGAKISSQGCLTHKLSYHSSLSEAMLPLKITWVLLIDHLLYIRHGILDTCHINSLYLLSSQHWKMTSILVLQLWILGSERLGKFPKAAQQVNTKSGFEP